MAKVERKAPYQQGSVELLHDPEVEGGVLLRIGEMTISGITEEHLQALAAGEVGDWQAFLEFQIGSRLHADDAAGSFEAMKTSIERAPFELLN